MAELAEDATAALRRRVDPALGRQGAGIDPQNQELGPGVPGEMRARLTHHRREAAVEADEDEARRGGARRLDPRELVAVERQRLLDQHRLALLERRRHQRRMARMARRDQHGIDRGIVEHRGDVGRARGEAVLLLRMLRREAALRHDGAQRHVAPLGQLRQQHGTREVAGADDPEHAAAGRLFRCRKDRRGAPRRRLVIAEDDAEMRRRIAHDEIIGVLRLVEMKAVRDQ